MKIRAGLLIDLGNSETRMTLLVGDKERSTILSNRFAALPPSYRVPEEYNNSKTSILEYKGTYYANARLAEREFVGQLIRPYAVEYKTDQIVTEISLNLVFLHALIQLSEAYATPIDNLEVTFDVSVLLPPLEHDTQNEKMEQMVRSITKVKSILPFQVERSFEIGEVKVLPEGVAAYFAVIFKEAFGALVEVEENKEFQEGYVMILDIGAGTTDVVLIKDTELLLNSKESFKRGGNTVESNLIAEINRKYKFKPQDIKRVINTGLLAEGGVVHDISDLLTEAKVKYTRILLPELSTYLERMSISLKEVKGILLAGGGSLPTIRDGVVVSNAMSKVLLEELQNKAPNTKIVSTLELDPRYLNITGLKYIHKYA